MKKNAISDNDQARRLFARWHHQEYIIHTRLVHNHLSVASSNFTPERQEATLNTLTARKSMSLYVSFVTFLNAPESNTNLLQVYSPIFKSPNKRLKRFIARISVRIVLTVL